MVPEEGHLEGSFRGPRIENTVELYAKINSYEQELMNVNEKLRLSEEEITNLKIDLLKYRPSVSEILFSGGVDLVSTEGYINTRKVQGSGNLVNKELLQPNIEIDSLEKELRITQENLVASEKQIASLKFEANKSSGRIQQLQDQLDLAQKNAATWKTKFNSEKRENAKLQERLVRLKSSLSDRDHEVRDLIAVVSDAERKVFLEKALLKFEMSKMLEEQTHLKEETREWKSRGRSFEDEIRKILSETIEMEELLKDEIEMLKADIETRENSIKDLNISLDTLKLDKDDLKMEHVHLIAGIEEAQRQVEKLKSKAKILGEEVEKQKAEIETRGYTTVMHLA